MAIKNSKFDSERFVSLFELWGRKNPSYEKHYEDEVIKPLTDFSKGTNEASESKAKVLGAGYEALIMAFFIGLYADKKLALNEDLDIKDLGQPIQFWGNLDSKKGRKAYPRLREYIFIALVAKTPEINWYDLDKGRWTPNETVNALMMTMEEYINYGLSVIKDKMDDDETFFMNQDSFLNIFQELVFSKKRKTEDDDKPEPLD